MAITSNYKKTDKHTATNLNKEGVEHAREAKIIDRIKINDTGNSLLTLKNHTENFLNRPTKKLLSLEIGRLSKHILQNINITLSEKLKVNEWKNTVSVINWFKIICNKNLYKFYPLINEKLLWEAVRVAKRHISITNKDIEVIFHEKEIP